MYRQRLKAKTGCDRCKFRRKKCDELRPVCGACRVHNLACSWSLGKPNSANTSREVVQRPKQNVVKRVAPILARPVTNGYQPFESETQFHLVMDAISYLDRMVQSGAMVDFSVLMTCALQKEWTRSSLAAFGAAFGSSVNSERLPSRSDFYSRACVNLRHHIMSFDRQMSVESLSCLAAATSLGLCDGVAPSTLLHFTAVAHMIVLGQWPAQDAQRYSFVKFAAEMSLYSLSWICLFDASCDDTLRAVNLKNFRSLLENTLETSTTPARSPLVWGMHDILFLMLEITLFGRQQTSVVDHNEKLSELSSRLDILESGFTEDFPGITQSGHHDLNTRHRAVLNIQCMRIILEKKNNFKLESSDVSIQKNVSLALNILTHLPLSDTPDNGLIWPALILLCAVDDLGSFENTQTKSQALARNARSTHRDWLREAINRIKKHRQVPNDTQLRDGLGLLVRPKGLLQD